MLGKRAKKFVYSLSAKGHKAIAKNPPLAIHRHDGSACDQQINRNGIRNGALLPGVRDGPRRVGDPDGDGSALGPSNAVG